MSQATVSLINSDIVAVIEAFAKSRKVSAMACLEAAAIALSMQPFENALDSALITTSAEGKNPTPASSAAPVITTGAAGAPKPQQKRIPRQAGTQSLEFREAVVSKASSLKGQRHTFAELGKMFNIDQANAVNNLKWLQKQKKIDFRVVGHATKIAGQKGRAPAIIEFV